MASYLGVCVDTAKRILHRNKLVKFTGAKYAMREQYEMWERPCLKCGCTAPRPKNQYYCDAHTPGHSGLPTSYEEF